MMLATSFALSALSLLGSVAAHGYVDSLTIGGKKYEGWKPFDDPYKNPVPQRATRKIKNDGPVTDWNSPAIVCNEGAPTTAGITPEAKPGDTVEFLWKWVPGHKGPVTTMLAKCPGDSCEGFSGASGAVWFMIQSDGIITPPNDSGDGGYWASDKLMDDGGKWTAKIPNDLAPGAYLMRHEILAMHSPRAPQFYPSCTQLKIGGSGTKTPSSSELVALPGFYEQDKKSVMLDIYTKFTSYKVAGPAVVSFGSGSGDPPADPPADNTSEARPTSTKATGGTTTKTVSTTVKKNSATSSPTSPPVQACKVTKKKRTVRSKRHVSERKRRLVDHNN